MKRLNITLCAAMIMCTTATDSATFGHSLALHDAELARATVCAEDLAHVPISAKLSLPLSLATDPRLANASARISAAAATLARSCGRPVGLIILKPKVAPAADDKSEVEPVLVLLAAIARIKRETGAEVLLVAGTD